MPKFKKVVEITTGVVTRICTNLEGTIEVEAPYIAEPFNHPITYRVEALSLPDLDHDGQRLKSKLFG